MPIRIQIPAFNMDVLRLYAKEYKTRFEALERYTDEDLNVSGCMNSCLYMSKVIARDPTYIPPKTEYDTLSYHAGLAFINVQKELKALLDKGHNLHYLLGEVRKILDADL